MRGAEQCDDVTCLGPRARPEQVAEAEHAAHEASAAYRRAQTLRLEQLRELNEFDIA
jgi:hypothetical protein